MLGLINFWIWEHECKRYVGLLLLIISLIVNPSYELFDCTMIATKAAIYVIARIEAL